MVAVLPSPAQRAVGRYSEFFVVSSAGRAAAFSQRLDACRLPCRCPVPEPVRDKVFEFFRSSALRKIGKARLVELGTHAPFSAQHDRMNATDTIHRPWWRRSDKQNTASTDLLAIKQFSIALDGVHDLKHRDIRWWLG